MLSLALLTANLAHAQSNTLIMAPFQLPYGTGETIGSPAVYRHSPEPGVDALFLVFETKLSASSGGCPDGEWGLGFAYTFDGTNWTLLASPLVSPTDDTYYSCVAAHPTVVPMLGDDSWIIYFKAEQDPGAVPGGAGWGSDRYTGLGRLTVSYNGSPSTGVYEYLFSSPDVTPVMQNVAQDMGYPSVVFANGEYHMAFAQNPDVYVVSYPFPTSTLAVPSSPVLAAGTSPSEWERDELFSPSLTCLAGTPSSFAMAVGGRVWEPYPTLDAQSVGVFTSSDLSSWTELPTLLHDRDTQGFEVKHLDLTTANAGADLGVFYTRPTTNFGNVLGLFTTAGWSHDTVDSKRCP